MGALLKKRGGGGWMFIVTADFAHRKFLPLKNFLSYS